MGVPGGGGVQGSGTAAKCGWEHHGPDQRGVSGPNLFQETSCLFPGIQGPARSGEKDPGQGGGLRAAAGGSKLCGPKTPAHPQSSLQTHAPSSAGTPAFTGTGCSHASPAPPASRGPRSVGHACSPSSPPSAPHSHLLATAVLPSLPPGLVMTPHFPGHPPCLHASTSRQPSWTCPAHSEPLSHTVLPAQPSVTCPAHSEPLSHTVLPALAAAWWPRIPCGADVY